MRHLAATGLAFPVQRKRQHDYDNKAPEAKALNLSELSGRYRDRIIFQCIAGSRAYGTAHAGSDEDIRGVFVLPRSEYLVLEEALRQLSDQRGDLVFYSLSRFLELALKANPNIIELLYMPEDCVRVQTSYWERLTGQRELFISRQAYASHVGYARAQIKKARGRNKWINRLQPAAAPLPENFCWFVPRSAEHAGQLPYRPQPLKSAGIDLHHCHASALEHSRDLFRLYHYGEAARGVFRNGTLVCESIPLEDEDPRCIGLLVFNQTGFERALADRRNYWEWRRNRNERRWQSQEQGEIDYDAKNMMHTFRLLLSAEHILREGCPLVRFSGPGRELLKGILAGRYTYGELIEMTEEKIGELGVLRDRSPLPAEPDRTRVTALLRDITAGWEADHA